MAMSRACYATGNAERAAAEARVVVRNELKNRTIPPMQLVQELRRLLAPIKGARLVPKAVREELEASIWAEFKIERRPGVLISTKDAADRRKRLCL